jgi:hypothetical protein
MAAIMAVATQRDARTTGVLALMGAVIVLMRRGG